MSQYTNGINYNVLQLHSNNSTYNNCSESNNRSLNGNYTKGFLSYTNNNSYNFKLNNNHSTHSPSAALTPGRKSASPTFFHTNDSLYNKYSISNNFGNYINSTQNGYGLNKHLNYNNNNIYSSCLTYAHINENNTSSHHEQSLKIPTTPTRSKSLSPSLRCVIQPPRLRYKQQNKTTDTKNGVSQTHNTMPANANTNRLDDTFKHILSNEKIFFEPISSLKFKSENCTNSKTNTQSNSNLAIDQTDKNSKNLSNLDNTKLSKLNEFDDKKVTIKKPIPIMPISCNNVKNDSSSFSKSNLYQNDKLNNNKSNLNENKKKEFLDSIESKDSSLDAKLNDHKCCEPKQAKQIEIKTEHFKLPLNVRMINLNNFPPNLAPNAKRHYSTSMQKIKSENLHSSDKCFNILKQSIQFIFNQEIKQVFDNFKQNFIDPAIKNYNNNKADNQISQQDLLFFIGNLLDEAKNSLLGSDGEEKKTPTTSSSFSSSTDTLKRKLENETDDMTGSEKSVDSVRKKCKKSNADDSSVDINESESTRLVMAKKEPKFDSTTKFVLGKNVNDVFFQIQQHFCEINSDDSNGSNQNDSTNPKSIYSKFPNLFRYEADQCDRQWLNENQIIKRKNIKCFILLLEDINELFMNNFKLNSNQILNETLNDDTKKMNDTLDDKAVILKKLKSFTLPDVVLYKLKKQYFIKKSKFV